MKTILFCQNPYAFGIMEPLMAVLKERNFEYIWFLTPNLEANFPFKNEPFTCKIEDLIAFKSDAIYVPGNEVPHYLRGLKVQIFHGLAGEKKGHFRIRHYFDLYLTQGPFFTKRFKELSKKYKDFDVIETGWPKLDVYGKAGHYYEKEKSDFLRLYGASKIVLYAPTFSPKLTSAPFLIEEFKKLASNKAFLIFVKFHDLMAPELISEYKQLAKEHDNIVFQEERNIVKYLLLADLLVSDTSSVVYEFILLNKPVLTFKSNSKNISWSNSTNFQELVPLVEENLIGDLYKINRNQIINEYHPYSDGKSAERMIDAVQDYIQKNGIPEKRKLSFLRRYKINKIFGKH